MLVRPCVRTYVFINMGVLLYNCVMYEKQYVPSFDLPVLLRDRVTLPLHVRFMGRCRVSISLGCL